MKKFAFTFIVLMAGVIWVFSNVVAEEVNDAAGDAAGDAEVAAEDVNEYVGNNEKTCKMCHKDQVKEWKTWPMAHSWEVLSPEEKINEACFPCHVTGYGKPGGFVSMEETPKLVGIQCEVCHGPAGAHMKVAITDKEGKKQSMRRPSEDMCVSCHNPSSPNVKEFVYEESIKKLEGHLRKK